MNSPASAVREIQFWRPTEGVEEQRGALSWHAGKWRVGDELENSPDCFTDQNIEIGAVAECTVNEALQEIALETEIG